jgi:hypothetical protein
MHQHWCSPGEEDSGASNVFNDLRKGDFGRPVALATTQEPGMKPITHTHTNVYRFAISLVAVAGLAAAQDQTPHAWRSVNDQLPASLDQAPDQSAPSPNINAQPNRAQGSDQNNAPPNYGPGQQNYPPQNYPPPPDNYGAPPVPSRLTIKPGTYVTVRINQWLSSDRNQKGDTFTAILNQPVIVDGIVVAQRGQTVYGQVSEAQKAGRVEGTSRLGLQLTQLTLVDGDQAPVQSQMVNHNGPTSQGRDAAAIGVTTGVGAAIGAGVNGGVGAGVGAGAGAVVGILGVLLTRGRPTVIYPESVLTFQISAPVEIATDRAPQAFQSVNTQPAYGRGNGQGYGQQGYGQGPATAYGPTPYPGPAPAPAYGYGVGAYPGYSPYAYGYPYPYYGGFGVYVGPGFGYGRGYYGGFRGGFRR